LFWQDRLQGKQSNITFLIFLILLFTSSVGFLGFGKLLRAPAQKNNPFVTYNHLPVFFEHHGKIKKLQKSSVSETEDIKGYFEFHTSKLNPLPKYSRLVAPIFIWRLPGDLKRMEKVNHRKKIFIKLLLPLLIRHNIAITQKRSFLKILMGKPILSLSIDEQNWLVKTALHYKVFDKSIPKPILTKEMLEELLNRIDIIPVSLALAQSSLETGWGTSRFSIHGNALFGQWTWKTNQGIRPKQRAPGKKYSVLRFSQLAESIENYTHNLNSSSHYRSFRSKRNALRKAGYPTDLWAQNLVEKLKKYSSNYEHYIPTVKAIIRENQLTEFDNYSLSP
jgi:Bax protein